jgi:selenocysteine-specific elongation factor
VHWVGNRQWEQWRRRLSALVTARRDDIDGLSRAEAHRQLELPAAPVLDALIESVPAVELVSGRLRQRGRQPAVDSPTEGAIRRLEQRLVAAPFAPPDLHQMAADGLDQQALAVAVVAGRLIRVSPEVYLLPDALEGAVALLAALPQPFTVAQARDALGSTRRVTIPLLQQLDASRRTRRIDDTCRTVTR